MLGKIYLGLGLLVLLAYGVMTFTGKEIGDPQRQKITPGSDLRSGSGSRIFFWHSGYRGGK
jgi:hypothetical protein